MSQGDDPVKMLRKQKFHIIKLLQIGKNVFHAESQKYTVCRRQCFFFYNIIGKQVLGIIYARVNCLIESYILIVYNLMEQFNTFKSTSYAFYTVLLLCPYLRGKRKHRHSSDKIYKITTIIIMCSICRVAGEGFVVAHFFLQPLRNI